MHDVKLPWVIQVAYIHGYWHLCNPLFQMRWSPHDDPLSEASRGMVGLGSQQCTDWSLTWKKQQQTSQNKINTTHCELFSQTFITWKVHNCINVILWWCHDMEAFSVSLVFLEGNPPVTSEFTAQKTSNMGFYTSLLLAWTSSWTRNQWFGTPQR